MCIPLVPKLVFTALMAIGHRISLLTRGVNEQLCSFSFLRMVRSTDRPAELKIAEFQIRQKMRRRYHAAGFPAWCQVRRAASAPGTGQ